MKSINKFINKYGSTILTTLGVLGVIGVGVLSSEAAIKASKMEDTFFTNKNSKNKLKTFKNTLKPYIPTVLVGSATTACILGSDVLNKKRQACLIGLYYALNESFTKYRNRNKEINGIEADQNVLESYLKDETPIQRDKKVLKAKESNSDNLENLFREETYLFYDTISERYFEATPLIVYSAEYNLCRMFNLFGYVDVNTFYSFLGIPETKAGAEVGWSMEDTSLFWISFTHTRTVMDDGLTCIIITPDVYPYPNYDDRLYSQK